MYKINSNCDSALYEVTWHYRSSISLRYRFGTRKFKHIDSALRFFAAVFERAESSYLSNVDCDCSVCLACCFFDNDRSDFVHTWLCEYSCFTDFRCLLNSADFLNALRYL